jgi:isoleucyl-tRNA synthetase
VWQSHPGLTAEAESVHLGEWPARPAPAGAEQEWEFLLSVRDATNRAIEPLRASKLLATTAEADVTITAPKAWLDRIVPYRDELTGFLLVAGLSLRPGTDGQEPEVAVARTAHRRCERCWTHRPDVAGEGPHAGLCGRCVAALAAADRPAVPRTGA